MTIVKVPLAVAGTLAPFTLTVDGKEVSTRKEDAISLRVSQKLVEPLEDSGAPFFLQSDADTLDFRAPKRDGKRISIPPINLPQVSSHSVEKRTFTLVFSGEIKKATLDGKALKVVNGQARWSLPTDEGTAARYVLRLTEPRFGIVRVFNITLQPNEALQAIHKDRVAQNWARHFRLGPIAAFQTTGGKSYSALVSWNPTWRMTDWLWLTAHLGLTGFKRQSASTFLVSEYQLFARIPFGALALEAGGGGQTWHGYKGSAPLASGNLTYEVSLLSFVEKIFVGYSRYLSSTDGASEFRAGLGVTF